MTWSPARERASTTSCTGWSGICRQARIPFPKACLLQARILPDGSHQTNGNAGQNGNFGYRPPCPPQDVPVAHHYAFELFALDQKLDLPATATRADVMKAMDGHIAGHAALVAPFNR